VIKILLVDDQVSVRWGLKMRFALEPDFIVLGQAGTGVEAIQAAQTLMPDVVVMDVEMPEMDGITATQHLHDMMPHVGVVMLSIHGDADTRARAEAAGACAFIEKQGADVILSRRFGAQRRWGAEIQLLSYPAFHRPPDVASGPRTYDKNVFGTKQEVSDAHILQAFL